jgi:hypothetical protein
MAEEEIAIIGPQRRAISRTVDRAAGGQGLTRIVGGRGATARSAFARGRSESAPQEASLGGTRVRDYLRRLRREQRRV